MLEQEYDVREIDAHGEVVDINSYPTLREAKRWAEQLLAMIEPDQAIVIERHRYGRLADCTWRSVYKTVAYYGSLDALAAGGWLSDD